MNRLIHFLFFLLPILASLSMFAQTTVPVNYERVEPYGRFHYTNIEFTLYYTYVDGYFVGKKNDANITEDYDKKIKIGDKAYECLESTVELDLNKIFLSVQNDTLEFYETFPPVICPSEGTVLRYFSSGHEMFSATLPSINSDFDGDTVSEKLVRNNLIKKSEDNCSFHPVTSIRYLREYVSRHGRDTSRVKNIINELDTCDYARLSFVNVYSLSAGNADIFTSEYLRLFSDIGDQSSRQYVSALCKRARHLMRTDCVAAAKEYIVQADSILRQNQRADMDTVPEDVAITYAAYYILTNDNERAHYYLDLAASGDCIRNDDIRLIEWTAEMKEKEGNYKAGLSIRLKSDSIQRKHSIQDSFPANRDCIAQDYYKLGETEKAAEFSSGDSFYSYMAGNMEALDSLLLSSSSETKDELSVVDMESTYFNYDLNWIKSMQITSELAFYAYQTKSSELLSALYDGILTTKANQLRKEMAFRSRLNQEGNEQDRNLWDDFLHSRQENRHILTYMDSSSTQHKELARILEQYSDSLMESTSFHQLQNSLGKRDLMIEFIRIPILISNGKRIDILNRHYRYAALLVDKHASSPVLVDLCANEDLWEAMRDSQSKEGLQLVYNLIWEPLSDYIKEYKNIYFSPDASLCLLPLEYAMDEAGKPMCEFQNLYRLTSTSFVKDKSRKKRNGKVEAVLYGGLEYDMDLTDLVQQSRQRDYDLAGRSPSRYVSTDSLRYGVEYLPNTKSEVEEIAMSLAKEGVEYQVIEGKAGTEESLHSIENKVDVGVLHLATHGFYWSDEELDQRDYASFLQHEEKYQSFEDKSMTRTGLLLSGANIGLRGDKLPDDVEDGVLTAQELSMMNLIGVDLVVLSACQSGVGDVTSEGVYGLQRGFKLAGVQSLLMSLWKVDDAATRMLMVEFYKHYLEGDSKIASLRKAQQYVRSQPQFDDPYYWAGFVLLDATD